MYSQGELKRIGAHKAFLQRRIARQRADCAVAAAHLLQPVEWLDRMLVLWRKFAPFAPLAAVPLGFLLKRTFAPRSSLVARLLRWGPVVLGAVRSVTGARAATARR